MINLVTFIQVSLYSIQECARFDAFFFITCLENLDLTIDMEQQT